MVSIIDIFVIMSLLYGAYAGYKKGFIIQFISFGILLVGIFLSNVFATSAAKIFPRFNLNPQYLLIILFLLSLIAAGYLTFLTEKMVENMTKDLPPTSTIKFGGLGIGTGKMFIVDSILVYLTNQLDKVYHFMPEDMITRSIFNDPMVQLAPLLFRFLNSYDFTL